MCISCNIFPVNHLKMCNKTYAGDFTYFKGYKKSQIDSVYTDRIGIKHFKTFDIVAENWHLSDHRLVFVEIESSEHINISMLLRRAKDLNFEFDPNHTKPKRYLSLYNRHIFKNCLAEIFANHGKLYIERTRERESR